jgi:hypothetical protein
VRIAVATSYAWCVGIWKRLLDEGNDVRVWRGQYKGGSPALLTSHRLVGKGIVPLCDSWGELLEWCKAGARAGEPTIMLFDANKLGKLADEARAAGVHVLGGGTFMDRLEEDRALGRDLAAANGIASPESMPFASVDDCLAFAESGKLNHAVYWKTDTYLEGDATHKCDDAEELIEYLYMVKRRFGSHMPCALEEKLPGFALSTARWWNGKAWVGPYQADLERKSFLPDGVGPSTGCAINAVTFYEEDEPDIAYALKWPAFASHFIKHNAPPGLYDINAIVQDGKAFFLEWTPRFGYDSEPVGQLLYPDYGRWLWYVATGQGDDVAPPVRKTIALSIRMSVPPAPWEHGERDEKGSAVGTFVRGETGDLWGGPFIAYELQQGERTLEVAGPEGAVGLSAAVGGRVSSLAKDVIAFAKDEMNVPGLMFWPSGVRKAIWEDAAACEENGITDLPTGLRA